MKIILHGSFDFVSKTDFPNAATNDCFPRYEHFRNFFTIISKIHWISMWKKMLENKFHFLLNVPYFCHGLALVTFQNKFYVEIVRIIRTKGMICLCFQSSNCSTRKSVTCIIFTHKLYYYSVTFYKNACEQNLIIGICICQHALYFNPIISHILVHICGMKKLNSGNELLMRFKWIDSMNFINA